MIPRIKRLNYIISLATVILLPANLAISHAAIDEDGAKKTPQTIQSPLHISKKPVTLSPEHSNALVYSITVSNNGENSPGADSIVIIDQVPGKFMFFNQKTSTASADLSKAPSPVYFRGVESGLTFNYDRDVAFSDSYDMPVSFADCTYKPHAGVDRAVRYICLNPKGIFSYGKRNPEFTIYIKVKKTD